MPHPIAYLASTPTAPERCASEQPAFWVKVWCMRVDRFGTAPFLEKLGGSGGADDFLMRSPEGWGTATDPREALVAKR